MGYLIFFLFFGQLIAVSWLDLPKSGYEEILNGSSYEIERVQELVERYHSYPKDSLKERIASLERLFYYLQNLSFDHDLLDSLIIDRIEYLKGLANLSSFKELQKYHLDISELKDERFEPLFLRNNRFYSLKMKEFWGEFWLESIDPCHRRLANYYQFWLDTDPKTIEYRDFFFWLESILVPKETQVVRYLTDQELERAQVVILDGYLVDHLQKKIDNGAEKRNIFIVNLKKELFLKSFEPMIFHTSLSHGKAVLASGLLDIKEGKIQRISFESGHYFPSLKNGFQTIEILKEQNAFFEEPFEVVYFKNRKKHKSVVFQSDFKSFKEFEEVLYSNSMEISVNEF